MKPAAAASCSGVAEKTTDDTAKVLYATATAMKPTTWTDQYTDISFSRTVPTHRNLILLRLTCHHHHRHANDTAQHVCQGPPVESVKVRSHLGDDGPDECDQPSELNLALVPNICIFLFGLQTHKSERNRAQGKWVAEDVA
jgi:hypothetical protein